DKIIRRLLNFVPPVSNALRRNRMAEIGSAIRRFSAKPQCAPLAPVVELERRGPRSQRKDRLDALLRPFEPRAPAHVAAHRCWLPWSAGHRSSVISNAST